MDKKHQHIAASRPLHRFAHALQLVLLVSDGTSGSAKLEKPMAEYPGNLTLAASPSAAPHFLDDDPVGLHGPGGIGQCTDGLIGAIPRLTDQYETAFGLQIASGVEKRL